MTRREREIQVLRNVISRLRAHALTVTARLYLETYVIPPLELMLPETYNIKLAERLSNCPRVVRSTTLDNAGADTANAARSAPVVADNSGGVSLPK